MLDLLTVGEALVEIMRTDVGQPLDQRGPFTGPYPSGAPFIFAAQAARMGAKVGAIGTVGNDAFGRCQLNQLTADGIDTRGVHVSSAGATGAAFIAYNTDGSRNFVFSLGVGGDLSPERLHPVLFDGLRCLHLMGSTLSMSEQALATGHAALELAQRHGARFSFDPNLRPELLPPEQAKTAFAPFVAAADVLLPTAEELLLLTGADDTDPAVHQLTAAQPDRVIVVTQGADGCTVYAGGAKTHVPGFTVTEVDPTGAGDCFDAGFLVRWLSGDAPHVAARWANACGALAVTKQGPMTGAMPFAEVEAFITANGGL